MRGLIRASVAIVAVMFTMLSVSAQDLEQELIDRIKPVGEVCIDGQECRASQSADAATDAATSVADATGEAAESSAEAAVASAARSGEEIYNKSCVICHAAGVAGAPKLADSAAWEPRLANGRDMVLQNSINGLGGMPPRGTCMDCSDEEMSAAVDYMLQGL